MSTVPTDTEIDAFLAEDIGTGDITAAIIPANAQAKAYVVTREDAVICGLAWFEAVFRRLSPDVTLEWLVPECTHAAAEQTLCRLTGPARALLTGERTALNLLQTLSATATIAKQYAAAVAGTGCTILDTRKTIPGLRRAQKHAVSCGGCDNHRMGLYDAILIKENHIAAAGSVAAAVGQAKTLGHFNIEVEVENLDEFDQAQQAGPDRILLDNFSLAHIRQAVARRKNGIELEVSGNIQLHQIRDYALTGIDFISVGALTKNIRAIDLSMRIEFEV